MVVSHYGNGDYNRIFTGFDVNPVTAAQIKGSAPKGVGAVKKGDTVDRLSSVDGNIVRTVGSGKGRGIARTRPCHQPETKPPSTVPTVTNTSQLSNGFKSPPAILSK